MENKPISHKLALIYGALTTVIFSIHYLVAKEVLAHVHPFSLTAFRGLLGGIILLVIFKGWRELNNFKKEFWSLMAIAFFGFFFNVVTLFYGIQKSTPVNAALIMNTIPLVSALLGFLVGQEKLGLRKVFGMLLGFSLVVFLTLHRQNFNFSLGQSGDIYFIASVLSLCVSFIIAKKTLSGKIPPNLVTLVTLLFGGLFSLLIGFSHHGQFIEYSFSSGRAIGLIIFEVIFSSAVVYYLSFKTLQTLSASQTTIFAYFQPLLTAGLGYLIYGNHISWVYGPVYLGIILSGYLVLKKD